MKKRLSLLLLTCLGLGGLIELNAQSVTVGGGGFVSAYTNTNDFGPMRNPAATAAAGRYAYKYPRVLLTGIPTGAQINSLEFRRNGTAEQADTSTMKIYMRNSTDSTYGPGNINWVTAASAATLVYDANTKVATGASIGFKRYTFSTPFTYTGGHLEILIESKQTAGPAGDIDWHYDNASGVPAYVDNSVKLIQVTGSTTFPSDSTSLSNLRKPQVVINFPAQNNVAIDRIFGSQYLHLNDTVVPSFYVKNTGLVNQTFTVTLQGPAGYTSTKTATAITPDSVHFVEFDAYAPATTGNFTYKVFTNLASDTYHEDDTLTYPVIVADPLATTGLFDNGPMQTDVTGGFNGYGISRLSAPLTTLGANGTIRTAEKFWLPADGNFKLDSIGFWAYQTGSGFTSTFTGIFMMIYDGDPSAGGQLIAGDSIDNLLSNTYFSGVMRASNTSLTDSTRPIMRIVGEFINPVTLTGGQPYWLVWSYTAGGTPFFPPITATGIISSGDAIQRSNTTFAWSLMNGGGIGFPAGAPFQVYFKPDLTSVNELDPLAAKVGNLYPNPAHNKFNVSVELQRHEKVEVRITDLQGRQLLVQPFGQMSEGKHVLELPAATLSNGMYLVQIQSGNQLVTRKLQIH